MSATAMTSACLAAATACAFAGLFAITFGLARERRFPGRRLVARHTAYLDRLARLGFVRMSGRGVVRAQAASLGVVLVVALGAGLTSLLLLAPVLLFGPTGYLLSVRRDRKRRFAAQTDAFVLGLANSLKAVPNIGAALGGLMPVLQDPIRQEIGVVLGELRVGSHVDQALLNASARAESPAFDGAVSALLIGRELGGDLPRILETTAGTLREMNRLEGVVRTKTSESRAQLWVLAFFPLGIVLLFSLVSPGFFDPLQSTLLGKLVALFAAALWLAALLIARNITKVDL